MEVSLDLYRVFAAVAKHGSLSGAAKELYISQPAVSQSIARLEEALGTRLFDRTPRGVILTPPGEILRGYTTSALGLMNAGEEKLRSLSTLQGGELHIGAGDTVTQCFLLKAIEHFHERYPMVGISITNRTSRETLRLLQEGKIDIGFVSMPISREGILCRPCLTVHDVFVAGNAYANRLAGRVLTFRELSGYPLIMLERAANSRRQVDSFFLKRGLPLSPGIELGSHSLLPDCARIGLGIACVIREFTNMTDLFEIQTEEELPARSMGICTLEGITLPEAAERFIAFVQEESRKAERTASAKS